MKKRRPELVAEKGDSVKREECSGFGGRGSKIEAGTTLRTAATTEGIPNGRSFQKHVCCVRDSCPQFL